MAARQLQSVDIPVASLAKPLVDYSSDSDTAMEVDHNDAATVPKRIPLTSQDIPTQTVHLQHLAKPALCAKHPERHEEIMDLYLRRTTFTVKVWTNYDAAPYSKGGSSFFYDHQRTQDCGQLFLLARFRTRLQQLNPNDFKMSKVRFEIGTPFCTLYTVHVEAVSRGKVVAIAKRVTDRSHPDLHAFVIHQCAVITKTDLQHGRKGMTLQDLEAFARLFVREQLQEPKTRDELARVALLTTSRFFKYQSTMPQSKRQVY